jgi:hypothetical protein
MSKLNLTNTFESLNLNNAQDNKTGEDKLQSLLQLFHRGIVQVLKGSKDQQI